MSKYVKSWQTNPQGAGWVDAVVGAIMVLFVYGLIKTA